MLIPVVFVLLLVQDTTASSRMFGCAGPLTADLTEQRLVEVYGATNVRSGDVDVGEGFSEPGATIFPDSPSDRVEVVWSDGTARARPRFVRITEKKTAWQTIDGMTVGSDLKTIERINRRPFRLRGFGWDYSGTVTSWSGGHLERRDTPRCLVRLRLMPEGDNWPDIWQQVVGTAEFSSGHPAMQQLNPRVTHLLLTFPGKD
jgi:hypothetical protein